MTLGWASAHSAARGSAARGLAAEGLAAEATAEAGVMMALLEGAAVAEVEAEGWASAE